MNIRGLTYDEALSKHVGEYGRGHVLIVALTSLFYIPNVIYFYLLVFTAVDPVKQRLWECTDTTDQACMAFWEVGVPRERFCELSPSQWRWLNKDNLAAFFNLVCHDRWKVQMLNMCMFIGCLIGAALFGYLNDGYGRKKPLLLATIICIVSVFASVAAPAYWYMAITRMLIGIGGAGQNQCVALLNAEIAGKTRRGMASITSSLFWSSGEFLLVGLAIALPNWRHLTLLAGGMTVGVLMLLPLVPESARWLLSQGRQAEATAVARKIARWNGAKLPEDITLVAAAAPTNQIDEEDIYADIVLSRTSSVNHHLPSAISRAGSACLQLPVASPPDKNKSVSFVPNQAQDTRRISSPNSISNSTRVSIDGVIPNPGEQAPPSKPMGLFAALGNPRLLKRTVVMTFTWFALYIVSYGVNLGSGSLPGSLYITFSFITLAEMVAQLSTFFVADKAGRHVIITVGLVLSGTACLACAMTENGNARAVLAVIGKFGCTVGMSVLGTFSCELFATPIRASAMGIFNESGRLGSIVAPLMLMVGAQVKPDNAVFVPFLAFGIAALLAGVLTLVLPETLGAAMPEDVDDMNQLMSLFTAKPWRQGSVATFKFMFRQKAVRAARQGRGSQTCKPPKTPGPPQHQQQGSPEKEGRASNPGMSLVEVHVDCPEVLISPTSQRRAEAVPGNVMTEALLSPTLQRRRSASVPGGPQQ